jgi:SAM-dependent methyltransferase
MTTPPDLFDLDLLALRRARAEAIGPADFLHEAVAAEVSERLSEVNRTFRDGVVVGPRPAPWARALAGNGLSDLRTMPDAPVLGLAPESLDLVIHGLALHWANDPVGQLVQARRALRPDGLFIAALFGGATLAELRAALAEAEVAEMGGLSPRVAPMGEIRDLGGLLQRAGFALPVADGARFDVTYPGPLALMRDLRAMGETNVMRERLRRPLPRRMLAAACALYAERFAIPTAGCAPPSRSCSSPGWAPAENQQKPLRPGSAAMRLADALGVPERSAGDKAGR